jgi:hypothetical protein
MLTKKGSTHALRHWLGTSERAVFGACAMRFFFPSVRWHAQSFQGKLQEQCALTIIFWL